MITDQRRCASECIGIPCAMNSDELALALKVIVNCHTQIIQIEHWIEAHVWITLALSICDYLGLTHTCGSRWACRLLIRFYSCFFWEYLGLLVLLTLVVRKNSQIKIFTLHKLLIIYSRQFLIRQLQ